MGGVYTGGTGTLGGATGNAPDTPAFAIVAAAPLVCPTPPRREPGGVLPLAQASSPKQAALHMA
jgi:hypothetical protein